MGRQEQNLESIDDRFLVLFDRIVRELRCCKKTERLERQVAQIRLAVRQKLTQLVASTNKKSCVTVGVDNQTNSLKEDGILSIGMLNLLRLGRLLGLVQYRLETFRQSASNTSVLCTTNQVRSKLYNKT